MIRPAEARDYAAYTRLFAELGVDDPVPSVETWTREIASGVLVYERSGQVVGYTSTRRLKTAAHVMNVAVAPEARRSGVGRALMSKVADQLRADGVREWHLNVKEENAPAIALYEGLGMRMLYRSAFTRFAWANLPRLRSEHGLAYSPVEPAEDDELEHAFELLPGRLAQIRGRGGRVIAKLRDARGTPAAVASFDPNHPGAYPFCTARMGCAGPLLAGLQPHARPGDAWLGIAVEDDAALVAELVAAGAEVRMKILHYRGDL